MKKLIYTAFVICGMLTASCSDLLNLESKTDVTNNYLFTTPEGLNTAVTGLYSLARELPGGADNNESNLYIVTMCDFNTDIAILRAGVSTSIGRLNTSFTPSTGDVNKFWKHHYGIIGKANEIIVAAEALGLDDRDVLLTGITIVNVEDDEYHDKYQQLRLTAEKIGSQNVSTQNTLQRGAFFLLVLFCFLVYYFFFHIFLFLFCNS